MDNAVALVQAYLHVNGYFTVCEFPVLRRSEAGTATVTDLDILAFRFPGAGQEAGPGGRPSAEQELILLDPVLRRSAEQADMLIGEVKEGPARLNDATTSSGAIAAALARFGCCPPQEADAVAANLVRHGATTLPSGHLLRLVAFGTGTDARRAGAATVIPLGHAVSFLQEYLRVNWAWARQVQFKDDALGMLLAIEKSGSRTA